MSLKEMNTGDRLIFWGNLLESLARTLISVGEILREKDLPANADVFVKGETSNYFEEELSM